LSKILEIPEFKSDEIFFWEPPKEYGLNNCDYIIDPTFGIHNNIKRAFDIDYFFIIKYDIKNFKKLNAYQKEYVKKLPDECKIELLEIYDDCMNTFIDSTL
jgi:hypothetical protein